MGKTIRNSKDQPDNKKVVKKETSNKKSKLNSQNADKDFLEYKEKFNW